MRRPARPARRTPRPPAAPGPPPRSHAAELTIEALGSRGDGLARAGGRPVHVPLALPGDRVEALLTERPGGRLDGVVRRWLVQGPRARPPCRHFGRCGGCRLQHLEPDQYRAWLSERVEAALRRAGLPGTDLRPPLVTPPASRRRMRFGWQADGGRVRLGLRALASHAVVELEECPIARPAIVALLAPLRATLADLGRGGPGEVLVTEVEGGLDVVLIRAAPPDLAERQRLAALAADADLARLAWTPHPGRLAEPLVVRRPVRTRFGGVSVELPPGAFLQATAEAETMIREAVLEALGDGAGPVADLFAGCGTFALPLAAAGREVLAVDADAPMIEALRAAAAAAGVGGRLQAATRDLERRPLQADELRAFAAAVLDPPRAGARRQVGALRGAGLGRVAMVSCNPDTFARDARVLVGAGYRLAWVQPIDPFLWSAEVELVGGFERTGPAAGEA